MGFGNYVAFPCHSSSSLYKGIFLLVLNGIIHDQSTMVIEPVEC